MGDGVPTQGRSNRVPAVTRKRWRYDGVGWPRSVAEIRPWIPGVVVVVAATIWGYVSIAPNGRIEAGRAEMHRTDFTVFTEAGSAFFDGRDPYGVSNPRGWHYLYPPLFALIVSPLSIFDTQSQVVIWYIINLVLSLGCVLEVRRLWVLSGAFACRLRGWLGVCAGMAVVLPFLDCMQSGQLGIGILYLLLLGFRLVVLGRSGRGWFLGGVILALPAAIKLLPALPVLFLVFQRWSATIFAPHMSRPGRQASAMTAGVVAGAFLFLLVIPASLVGWSKNLHYLNVWYNRVVVNERVGPNANFNIHSFRNQSLANAWYLWSQTRIPSGSRAAPPPYRPERVVHPSVRVVIGGILALLMVIGLIVGSRRDQLDQATAYGLACGVTLLVSPLSWGHYYMIQLPALLCVPVWLARRGMTTLGRAFALVPAVTSWAHYVAPPIAERGVLGLVTTIWFLGALGLIVCVGLARALAASSSSPSEDSAPSGRLHAIPPPHLQSRSGDRHAAGSAARSRSNAENQRGLGQ
jgi:Glycosyltransferase family 87